MLRSCPAALTCAGRMATPSLGTEIEMALVGAGWRRSTCSSPPSSYTMLPSASALGQRTSNVVLVVTCVGRFGCPHRRRTG